LLECILNYMALGRRGVERPRKRWKDIWAETDPKACALKLKRMIDKTSKVSIHIFSSISFSFLRPFPSSSTCQFQYSVHILSTARITSSKFVTGMFRLREVSGKRIQNNI
jgi:hypothetical protein